MLKLITSLLKLPYIEKLLQINFFFGVMVGSPNSSLTNTPNNLYGLIYINIYSCSYQAI